MEQHSPIVLFYLGEGPDNRGRMIDEIWRWEEQELEDDHSYIQWLFPLNVRSEFNPDAPVLSEADIAKFKNYPRLNTKLFLSLAIMLNFYGFTTAGAEGNNYQIIKSKDFERRSKNWLTKYNHNFLRITRMLKSLVLLGRDKHALVFLNALELVYNFNFRTIGLETIGHWREPLNIRV